MQLKLDYLVDCCDEFCQACTEEEVMEQLEEHVESAYPEVELGEATVNRSQDNTYEI